MSGLGGRRRWIVAAVVGAAVIAGNVARRRARGQAVPDGPADVAFMRALHAALRRDLARLQAVAGQLDGTPPPTVLAGWNAFRKQLEIHHAAEDSDLWPRLRAQLTEPADLVAVNEMVAEHQLIPAALADVDAALRGGRDATAPAQRLATVLLNHLDHEERVVLPLIERHLTRAQWQEFLRTERSHTPVRERPEFLTWILDDAAAKDSATVLAEIPPPARLVYRRILRPRYQAERRWQLAER